MAIVSPSHASVGITNRPLNASYHRTLRNISFQNKVRPPLLLHAKFAQNPSTYEKSKCH